MKQKHSFETDLFNIPTPTWVKEALKNKTLFGQKLTATTLVVAFVFGASVLASAPTIINYFSAQPSSAFDVIDPSFGDPGIGTPVPGGEPTGLAKITSIFIPHGPAQGGKWLQITGTNFGQYYSPQHNQVIFGDVVVPSEDILFWSDTYIRLFSPAGVAGSIIWVKVKNVVGFSNGFPYWYYDDILPPPFITEIIPDHAPVSDMHTIAIYGGNFYFNEIFPSTAVKFGDKYGDVLISPYDDFIYVLPPHGYGESGQQVLVTVTTPNGGESNPVMFTFD